VHILVLADRDWTHPEAGGSGHNLRRQVEQFRDRGHQVSVVAAGYRGGLAEEQVDGVLIRRLGGRSTVFPIAIRKVARGLGADADVVLEVINGITFLTPVWLRRPHVALVHHLHAGRHYVEEMGWLGRPAGALLETLPLRWLYRHTRFVAVSRATQNGLIGLSIPRDRIAIAYNGVDEDMFVEPKRDDRPTFVVLGRLKRYKRIELILEAVADIPECRLEIAGDGSHRDAILSAVGRLHLQERVTYHGHVDEATKRELLRRSWANVTASAAEGWGLTITEAAACGTPSIGLASGGLREAIVHEQTGLLARDADELRERMRRLANDRELVERLGAGARERVRALTWERTADVTLDALEATLRNRTEPARREPLLSDTLRAAGLAAAVIANTAIALVCTVVFARWLGIGHYGTLASLLACFLILTVPGSALQATVARDVSQDPGGPAEILARRAMSAVLLLALPLAAVIALARGPIASVLGVNLQWAAAAAVWFGWLWIALSIRRGLFQGHHRYRPIGASLIVEAGGRLLFGIVLLAIGLGATGALLGTGFAIAAAWAVLARADRKPMRRGRPIDLWSLARRGGAPLLALSLVAVIQNADVILVRHTMSSSTAAVYSVSAVAARGILWFGVGLGLFLLPEAARRARRGVDARGVLAQMIGLVCIVAIPLIVVYLAAGVPLLGFVLHAHRQLAAAAGALPVLSVGMTLLAISYLVLQYMLALRRRTFVVPLLIAALAESAAILLAGASFERVALAIVVVQALLLGGLLAVALTDSWTSVAPEEPVWHERREQLQSDPV
jgi:glycosyltransferase involved in cell wall biosynthesis/O-antigen/teichoic acid export membrane protein